MKVLAIRSLVLTYRRYTCHSSGAVITSRLLVWRADATPTATIDGRSFSIHRLRLVAFAVAQIVASSSNPVCSGRDCKRNPDIFHLGHVEFCVPAALPLYLLLYQVYLIPALTCSTDSPTHQTAFCFFFFSVFFPCFFVGAPSPLAAPFP